MLIERNLRFSADDCSYDMGQFEVCFCSDALKISMPHSSNRKKVGQRFLILGTSGHDIFLGNFGAHFHVDFLNYRRSGIHPRQIDYLTFHCQECCQVPLVQSLGGENG